MEGEMLEGFICPLCYKDLKTLLNLNAHFQEHVQEDQRGANTIKGFYDKTLKKIKRSAPVQQQQDSELAVASSSRRIPGYPASFAVDVGLITSRSHLDRFKALRDLRNDRYAKQTNTILIRLKKLLDQLPSDPIRRKAYEREIVPWLNEKDVNLCPGCAKPFNLLKRKHHCRLCGSVMCHYCTFLLPLDDARKIVSETNTPPQSAPPSPLSKVHQQAIQAVLALDGLAVADFRICEHCNRLLIARETAKKNRSERPIIAQFYERMRAALDACHSSVSSYHDLYASLCSGESKHTLDEAKAARIEVIRLADSVDGTSKKIASLGVNSDPPPSAASLKLQQSIRNAAAQYLKKNIITLPSLPTEQEVFEFQERKRIEIERRIEEEQRIELDIERRRMQETKEQMQDMNLSGASTTTKLSGLADGQERAEGWTPLVQRQIISDDPLLQQIGILHGFIDQARRAGKVDECQALERNLLDLNEALDQREAANNS